MTNFEALIYGSIRKDRKVNHITNNCYVTRIFLLYWSIIEELTDVVNEWMNECNTHLGAFGCRFFFCWLIGWCGGVAWTRLACFGFMSLSIWVPSWTQSYGFQVKGLKKLENYLKKDDEVRFWKARASPEDIEYFECQLELQQELLLSFMNVERVIGNCNITFISAVLLVACNSFEIRLI